MKRSTPNTVIAETVFYVALLAAMTVFNFSLPKRELLSVCLLFAALSCGKNPFLCCAEYLLAAIPLCSLHVLLCAAVQSAFLLVVFCVYRRLKKQPRGERFAYALLVQLPFLFLFPHEGYELFPLTPFWQKTVLSLLLFLLCLLLDGGVRALLFRAFRCRLTAQELGELCLTWAFFGVGLARLCGETVLFALTLGALFAAVLLLKNASGIPFAVALSIPLCTVEASLLPCALFTLFACATLLFSTYGKIPSALTLFACVLLSEYFDGLFLAPVQAILTRLIACALPLIVLSCIPEKMYQKLKHVLLFYRERTLPLVAINRNRRAVGERLYEVSALFREIGTAFERNLPQNRSFLSVREAVERSLCRQCPDYQRCTQSGVRTHLDGMIAVGCSKGKVTLIDLPTETASSCTNCAGLLLTLNRQLEEYKRHAEELESARIGRTLLAEQAHGVSEILRDLALEQSEELHFADTETRLASALASRGILCPELFLYGEGSAFTVSFTLSSSVGAKELCGIASEAVGFPLTLADKIPLSADSACFVLKRRAKYDAAFGIASRTKDGGFACGDTHSILKIDERRFLVALSDGMGSGEKARDVSDTALSLIESFYKAKMPSQTILSTVNKLLSFSAEETFACLDIAAVNLDSGIADIVKIGSPVGFILSEEKLRVLEGQSLPMGMLDSVRPATLCAQMEEDDFLLFMSDGVTSAFPSSTDLYSFLSSLHPLNPQSLAERILSEAFARYGNRAEDDMTVLAVKIMRSA